MARLCFASFEIYPTVKGGAGVLLHNVARLLLGEGHEVLFLLDLTAAEFQRFDQIDRLQLPNPQACRAYRVEDLAGDLPIKPGDFRSVFEYRSYRFHKAASQLCRLEQPELIEFFEYTGSAYTALCAKAAGLDYAGTHISVRLHGSLELIDRQQPGSIHGIDRYLMYGLERHALRLAETVVYPSQAFLEQAYLPIYEPWFGQAVLSPPPLIDIPVAEASTQIADTALFYGRLHGIKGVDTFVDAAVLYLNEPSNPPLRFSLVGYDSHLPPGGEGSYQAYLLEKIPQHLRGAFQFHGQLSWSELGHLLPQVCFAAIPSHYESFCYAAHELYEARIPLIVSDLPAFQGIFQHERNALVFDGSASDLAVQMKRLRQDDALRQRITRPYPVSKKTLDAYYQESGHPGWIETRPVTEPLSLLVCILCDHPEGLASTLAGLKSADLPELQIVLLLPWGKDNGIESFSGLPAETMQEGRLNATPAWLLGKMYTLYDLAGRALAPTELLTAQALLLLCSGDRLDNRFLQVGLSTLSRQPQINFVSCYKDIHDGARGFIDTFPIDAAPELAPFLSLQLFTRAILRTSPGQLLIDVFDPRAGRYGELEALWRLDTAEATGIVIPEVLLHLDASEPPPLDEKTLDYIILRDDQPWRKSRLSSFPLTLANRSHTLREQVVVENRDDAMQSWLRSIGQRGYYALGHSRLNRWVNQHAPWLKRMFRK